MSDNLFRIAKEVNFLGITTYSIEYYSVGDFENSGGWHKALGYRYKTKADCLKAMKGYVIESLKHSVASVEYIDYDYDFIKQENKYE